jgi:hypothetical protein
MSKPSYDEYLATLGKKHYSVTVTYTCGHTWMFKRGPGVSDWANCICNSCQPWDGAVDSVNKCKACGGTGGFLKSDVRRPR